MSPPSGSPLSGSRPSGSPLAGKRVVLGVCGGIAAYKAVEVCRRLSDAGALVSPVLTESATRFVGALTFSALAAEPARTSLFSDRLRCRRFWDARRRRFRAARGRRGGRRRRPARPARPQRRCDSGGARHRPLDRMLRGGYFVRPAERHPARYSCPGARLPGHARRDVGAPGRAGQHRNAAPARVCTCSSRPKAAWRAAISAWAACREPEEIVAALAAVLARPAAATAEREAGGAGRASSAGVRAVVSAGGTREPLDPVRYIGNRSSGKQGYAIASELRARGAQVTLVTSSDLAAPADVDVVEVETAAEMANAVLEAAAQADVVVMAAAVADYRPAVGSGEKAEEVPRRRSLSSSYRPLTSWPS